MTKAWWSFLNCPIHFTATCAPVHPQTQSHKADGSVSISVQKSLTESTSTVQSHSRIYAKQQYFLHHDSESFLILSGVRFFSLFCCWLSEYWMLATIAVSNTSFRFFWVSAEHSMYETACTSSAHTQASSGSTGLSLYWASWMSTLTSCRRSAWVPTSSIGALGQCRRISGTHFSLTFWNEEGLTTLKQSRKMSALV